MSNLNLVEVDLNRDIQEISTYIQGYIDKTYLSQIRNQVKSHQRQSGELHFPEVQLLNAMVPFVPEAARNQFSQMVKMISYSMRVQNMLPNYGVENLFTRTDSQDKKLNDYIREGVMALVLYKAITWAEESEGEGHSPSIIK